MMPVGVLFLDLDKAFNTVCHEILLCKLKNIGFRRSSLTWFESYLSGRNQVTVVGDSVSSQLPVKCGVPQGSILGPLLFICYINDISRNCIYTVPYIYADDTALVVRGVNKNDVEWKLQYDINNLKNWFCYNKLSIWFCYNKLSI